VEQLGDDVLKTIDAYGLGDRELIAVDVVHKIRFDILVMYFVQTGRGMRHDG
jgi:hypothetical protein